MVTIYLIILAVVEAIILISATYFFASNKAKKNKLYSAIIRLFVFGAISVAAYMGAIGTHSLKNSEIFYSLWFASVDWMLISMLYFARYYTKIWTESAASMLFVVVFAILDNISLMTNSLWHHAFLLHKSFLTDKTWCFTFEINDFYFVHLTFDYIIVAIILIMFIAKSLQTGVFQKSRYVCILCMFLIIIIIDALFIFLNTPVDISTLLYAILALFIGYYAIHHNPRSFVEYMLSTITERMDCALIAFDENDNCIYANQLATRIFNSGKNKHILDDRFREWRHGQEVNNIANCSWNDIYVLNGEELRYDVHFNKIYDKKGYYCGCYFSYYDITSDYMAFEEEKYRSSHDPLTGALNRDSFYEEVKHLLNTYPATNYVMICSDIKGFKLINDMFGLDVADRVLIKIADSIREKVEAGSAYARLEADRFAVFMPKDRYSEELFLKGMREVERVLKDSQYHLNIQLGVYDIYDREASVASMCDRAFMAIESIKGSYNNQIAYYGDMLRNEYMNEQKVIGEFQKALEEGQFTIFLQPIVDGNSNLKLAEALVRWIHPEKGIVTPNSFIPILENTGLIYKLDMFVWEQAAKRLALWRDKGIENYSISVNISVKDFYYIDVFDTFTDLVEKYNINPALLKLEITESVFMTEKDRQIDIINALKDYGFLVEIDDFGSGYSSLNMLKELPANILKIDMAFLSVSENETKSRKIVSTIISLAKALDMEVVVEGIETKEQVDYLKVAGCDLFQGYYFDRPLPIHNFEDKYL